jgi:predicted transposase/invertase (TIGR01784 family)
MMPYDPFDRDRMVYTVKNHCVELPDMPYDDGAKTLFLYTKGREGNPSKELQELLRYMGETTKDNACNKMLRDIHKMVTKVKQDSGVTLEYMKIFEREKMLYEDGKEDGIKEGREEGRLEKLVSQVFKKLRKNCDVCEIADMLEEDEHVIQRICDAAWKYAPEYDEEKCAELLEQMEHPCLVATRGAEELT